MDSCFTVLTESKPALHNAATAGKKRKRPVLVALKTHTSQTRGAFAAPHVGFP